MCFTLCTNYAFSNGLISNGWMDGQIMYLDCNQTFGHNSYDVQMGYMYFHLAQ